MTAYGPEFAMLDLMLAAEKNRNAQLAHRVETLEALLNEARNENASLQNAVTTAREERDYLDKVNSGLLSLANEAEGLSRECDELLVQQSDTIVAIVNSTGALLDWLESHDTAGIVGGSELRSLIAACKQAGER